MQFEFDSGVVLRTPKAFKILFIAIVNNLFANWTINHRHNYQHNNFHDWM